MHFKKILPRLTPGRQKALIISNMLRMFTNNTYADFRTANKHILIHSYVIQMI